MCKNGEVDEFHIFVECPEVAVEGVRTRLLGLLGGSTDEPTTRVEFSVCLKKIDSNDSETGGKVAVKIGECFKEIWNSWSTKVESRVGPSDSGSTNTTSQSGTQPPQ